MSNHVPVMDKPRTNAQVHAVALFEIKNLERYYEAKVQAGSSKTIPQNLAVHFGSKSVAPPATCDKDSDDSIAACYDDGALLFSDTSIARDNFGSRCVPPYSVNKDDDYHSLVLKKDSSL